MSDTHQMEQLFAQIGPLMDRIEAIDQEDDDRWILALGEEQDMFVDFDQQASKLTFSIEVGQPPEELRLRAYEMLLAYNYLWEDSGGLRMALDSPEGSVVMAYDTFDLDMDVSALSALIDKLMEAAEGWRDVIADLKASGPSPESDAMGPAIRV